MLEPLTKARPAATIPPRRPPETTFAIAGDVGAGVGVWVPFPGFGGVVPLVVPVGEPLVSDSKRNDLRTRL